LFFSGHVIEVFEVLVQQDESLKELILALRTSFIDSLKIKSWQNEKWVLIASAGVPYPIACSIKRNLIRHTYLAVPLDKTKKHGEAVHNSLYPEIIVLLYALFHRKLRVLADLLLASYIVIDASKHANII
jgi:hypothetical protein